MLITSEWSRTVGVWDDNKTGYKDIKTIRLPNRKLEMVITDGAYGKVLRFIGGPTGHESYYIEDLLIKTIRPERMVICAGTINSWSICSVLWSDVKKFLKLNNFIKD